MIYSKNEEEIYLIKKSASIVEGALAEIAKIIEPGITGLQIDKLAEEFIKDNNASPGFKGYNNFPNTLCISVNDQVVHGIPSKIEFVDGDIVSVDCGVLKDGFYGDSAYSFGIGIISDISKKLLSVTKESLYKGISFAVAGKRTGDIGNAIQQYVEDNGFSVVRELVGHGLGKSLHEGPEVPNYGRTGHGYLLKEGLVLAIEPMINIGKKEVIQDSDGWTIKTSDKKFSAHFEHDIVVRKDKAEILSSFDLIEVELRKKNILY